MGYNYLSPFVEGLNKLVYAHFSTEEEVKARFVQEAKQVIIETLNSGLQRMLKAKNCICMKIESADGIVFETFIKKTNVIDAKTFAVQLKSGEFFGGGHIMDVCLKEEPINSERFAVVKDEFWRLWEGTVDEWVSEHEQDIETVIYRVREEKERENREADGPAREQDTRKKI